MRFLTIGRLKDTASQIPPNMARQLLEATIVWMNQQKQAGIILEVYAVAGWHRTVAICEHKSAEEIVQVVTSTPFGAFMDFEVYPLADFDTMIKVEIEAVKKAEKLFPPPPK